MTDDPQERYWHDDGPVVGEHLPRGGTVRYHLELVAGRIAVTRVIVERPAGITGRTLRLSPGAAVEVFLRDAEELRLLWDGALVQSDSPEAEALLRMTVKGRSVSPWSQAIARYIRRGRRPGDRLTRLAVTAALYVDALRRRVRAPNEDVAHRQRRTAALVRDDLKRARDAGLLTDAPGRGVAGGELTEEAERILEGLDQ